MMAASALGRRAYRRWKQRLEAKRSEPAAFALKLDGVLSSREAILNTIVEDARRGWIADTARALAVRHTYLVERTVRLDQRNAIVASVIAAHRELTAMFPAPVPEPPERKPPQRIRTSLISKTYSNGSK